jgi:hypothetical protein
MALWFKVSADLMRHKKSVALAGRLHDDRAWAYVVQMWGWFVEQEGEGIVIGPDAAYLLARGAGWTGDADEFCRHMLAVGFIEAVPEGFRVHDWDEWAGVHVEIRRRDRARKSKGVPVEVHGNSNGSADGIPPDCLSTLCISDLASQGGAGGTPSLLVADSPVAASLPCSGSAKEYGVTLSQVTEWQHAYPGVDVLGEIAKARAWLTANPTRRKTHGGMARFLVAWMSRAQDAPRNGSAAPARTATVPAAPSTAFTGGKRVFT